MWSQSGPGHFGLHRNIRRRFLFKRGSVDLGPISRYQGAFDYRAHHTADIRAVASEGRWAVARGAQRRTALLRNSSVWYLCAIGKCRADEILSACLGRYLGRGGTLICPAQRSSPGGLSWFCFQVRGMQNLRGMVAGEFPTKGKRKVPRGLW